MSTVAIIATSLANSNAVVYPIPEPATVISAILLASFIRSLLLEESRPKTGIVHARIQSCKAIPLKVVDENLCPKAPPARIGFAARVSRVWRYGYPRARYARSSREAGTAAGRLPSWTASESHARPFQSHRH